MLYVNKNMAQALLTLLRNVSCLFCLKLDYIQSLDAKMILEKH